MKKFAALFLSLVLVASLLASGCRQSGGLTEVTLNEVAHSIFYAPQYAAIELGYFEEEGIQLELVTGFGAGELIQR